MPSFLSRCGYETLLLLLQKWRHHLRKHDDQPKLQPTAVLCGELGQVLLIGVCREILLSFIPQMSWENKERLSNQVPLLVLEAVPQEMGILNKSIFFPSESCDVPEQQLA